MIMQKRKPQLTEKALIERIEQAKRLGNIAADTPYRAEFFIASLCGALDYDHPRAARSLAEAAGMSHLYEAGASQ